METNDLPPLVEEAKGEIQVTPRAQSTDTSSVSTPRINGQQTASDNDSNDYDNSSEETVFDTLINMETDDLPRLEGEIQVRSRSQSSNTSSVSIPQRINGQHAASDSDSNDDDDDDDNAEQTESEIGEQTMCLFCDTLSPSIECAIKHLNDTHNLNLCKLKMKFHMDQYSYIKLINCIRTESISVEQLTKANKVFWSDEKYLKPSRGYESWLSYDFEALHVGDNPNRVTIKKLLAHITMQSEMLKLADQDMMKMRAGFDKLLNETDIEVKKDAKQIEEMETMCVAKKSLASDESYFSSYAHFGIHHEMLSDVVRTTSYRDALLKNKPFMEGKTVLDVGCGTSVLSIFAKQAGASKVVGIDNSDIIYNAMSIVRLNDIQDIELVKGRLEDTELPMEKYDIIISEWMGYFLLFECMLDSIIYARDKHLNPGGVILPNRCTLNIMGYGSEELYARHIGFWNDVYGLNMSNMIEQVLHEPLIEIVDAQHILTGAETIADLNMATVELNYTNFTHHFELSCTKDGTLSAFVGYFDTFFELPKAIMFGTAPTDKPTHWKQVVFFINKPQAVKVGDVIKGKIVCRRLRTSARSLDIVIEVFGKRHTYYLE